MCMQPIDRVLSKAVSLGMTQTSFATAMGLNVQVVNNWKKRGIPPAQYAAIAKTLGVSIEWIINGGDVSLSNVAPVPNGLSRMIPLISWVQAGNWCEAIDNYAAGDAETWLPCPVKAGSRAFALRVTGASMEPKYQEGEMIYVDPDRPPLNKKDVVVRNNLDNSVTFKQLVIEDGRMYLRPLNPDWKPKIIPLDEHCTICGVVFFRGMEV